MFQVSPMHLFRATQSEAQFLFKTAQQEFEVLMTHGDRVAIHSEFLLSRWAMPFIQRHHTAFFTGCKETCSIKIVHKASRSIYIYVHNVSAYANLH